VLSPALHFSTSMAYAKIFCASLRLADKGDKADSAPPSEAASADEVAGAPSLSLLLLLLP